MVKIGDLGLSKHIDTKTGNASQKQKYGDEKLFPLWKEIVSWSSRAI